MYSKYNHKHPNESLTDFEKNEILKIYIQENKDFAENDVIENLYRIRLDDLAIKEFAGDVGLALREILMEKALDDFRLFLIDNTINQQYLQEQQEYIDDIKYEASYR